ncbi:sulfate anion transporter [Cyathus striatus]|nr:sulfate anion transporter [Cyathus striatus]
MTGLCFFLLGVLKLGVIVGFFPRHILVGCIGGVGVFLLITGFAVSMRIPDDDFTASLETLKMMFLDGRMLLLWTIPLLLAVLLRIVTTRWHHQLIFPLYFIIIPLIFYVVITAAQIDLYDLRKAGWLFDMGDTAHEPWWQFYTYLDFRAVRFGPLWSTLPTQFALLFFNILHPPLNVPALAVSLNDDVDTNKELVAHGYSNLLAGLVGLPNYLVYVNTLLFYRVGGGTRIAGFLLAVATALLLIIGTGPIAYIPVMVVGALIFVLGLDLVKEALWDTRHRVSRTEYITIVSIMVCMTVWDFVIGVLFGIVVSCKFFFVVQNSRRRSIRAIFTGDSAMSAVRRPYSHREYLREVTKQTTVLRLQGFLFFGTIAHVEETIRSLIDGPAYQLNPVRFLVLDLSLVAAILSAKLVTLVLCGFVADTDSSVGQALESVGVLGADGVELFNTLTMQWNSQKVEVSSNALTVPERQDADIEYSRPFGSFVRSPRWNRTIAVENPANQVSEHHSEPLKTLMQTFSSYGEVDATKFRSIQRYFECIAIPAGYLLWKQGDPSDGYILLCVCQSSSGFEESMAPFTVAGELSALSDSPRNATVVAEHASRKPAKLQVEEPELSRTFFQLVLKTAKTDYDILLLSLASRQ